QIWRVASPQRLAKWSPVQEPPQFPILQQELPLSPVQLVTLVPRSSAELLGFPQLLVLPAEFAEQVVVPLLAASRPVQAQARAHQSRVLLSFVAEHFSEV